MTSSLCLGLGILDTPLIDSTAVEQIFHERGIKNMKRNLASPSSQPDSSDSGAEQAAIGKPTMPFPTTRPELCFPPAKGKPFQSLPRKGSLAKCVLL